MGHSGDPSIYPPSLRKEFALSPCTCIKALLAKVFYPFLPTFNLAAWALNLEHLGREWGAAPGWGNQLSPSSCPAQLDGWIHEKMLMARDGTREDGHKLHKRWLRHQAFMAELAQNKEWLEKIERVRTQKAPLPMPGARGLQRTHVPPCAPSTASLLFPHL